MCGEFNFLPRSGLLKPCERFQSLLQSHQSPIALAPTVCLLYQLAWAAFPVDDLETSTIVHMWCFWSWKVESHCVSEQLHCSNYFIPRFDLIFVTLKWADLLVFIPLIRDVGHFLKSQPLTGHHHKHYLNTNTRGSTEGQYPKQDHPLNFSGSRSPLSLKVFACSAAIVFGRQFCGWSDIRGFRFSCTRLKLIPSLSLSTLLNGISGLLFTGVRITQLQLTLIRVNTHRWVVGYCACLVRGGVDRKREMECV